jgi:hypothetical protein
MTDNDIRAGVVASTDGSPRRRPVVDSRMPDGPLVGRTFRPGPSTTATPGLTDQLTDVNPPAGV